MLFSGDDSEISTALRRMGLVTLARSDSMDLQQELCHNLLIILFTVLWKGVEGSDNDAWKVWQDNIIRLSFQ